MMVSRLSVELFTDPACPFAFSHEPVRQRLRWHYGDGLAWTPRMIVLTREPGEAEKLAEGAPGLQRQHGMPINPARYPRPASSEIACRAVVAVRRHAPELAEPFLRCLRVRTMSGGLIDDPTLIDDAARDAGLASTEVRRWSEEPETAAELERDAHDARRPSAAARALDHKLGGPADDRRYTAPSYLIGSVSIPGFNPIETYETIIAHLAPELPRRPRPDSVAQLLAWATEPIATAEVALTMVVDINTARDALTECARFTPAGADGYWTR